MRFFDFFTSTPDFSFTYVQRYFYIMKFTSKPTFISILIVALSYYFFCTNNPINDRRILFLNYWSDLFMIVIASEKKLAQSIFYFVCAFLIDCFWGLKLGRHILNYLIRFTSIIFFLVSISAIRNDLGKKLNGWAISVVHLSFTFSFANHCCLFSDNIVGGYDLFHSPKASIWPALKLMAIHRSLAYVFIENHRNNSSEINFLLSIGGGKWLESTTITF